MEIKCNICGTINDGSTNFCKGCFQKLDEERKVESLEPKIEPIIEVPIEEEKEKEIPWVGEETENSEESKEAEVPNNSFEEINEPINDELEKIEVDIPIEENNEIPIEAETTLENNEEISWDIQETPIEEVSENIVETNSPIEPIQDTNEVELPIEEISWETSEDEQTVEETKEFIEDIPVVEKIVNEETNNVTTMDETWDDENTEWNKQDEIIEGIPELIQGETNNNWNEEIVEEPEKEEKQPKFILKFLITYVISSIVLFGIVLFASKYVTNMFDEETGSLVEFIINRVVMVVVLLLTTKLTFLKAVPSEDKLNKVTFSILSFIAIPGILIQLFVLGFVKDTKVLLFTIAIILAVITLEIFFSYIRNMIMKKLQVKKDDKTLFIYGISSIVIVVILLVFGMFARTKNLDMPKINFLYNIFHNEEKDTELITNFIYSVEKTILRNQTDDPNYVMPTTITDVSFATYEEKTPDSLELTINENGGVVSGTITYRDITYQYNEGSVKE